MAEWIPELMANLIAQSWAVSLLYGDNPDMSQIASALQPEIELHRSDGSFIALDAAPAVATICARASKGPGYTSTSAFVNQSAVVLIQLGDAFNASGIQAKHGGEPLLQFLRHVRNGLSHGSYFSFDNKVDLEARPARLRNIELTHDHDNHAVFSVIQPGDVMDLLEDLHRFLVTVQE